MPTDDEIATRLKAALEKRDSAEARELSAMKERVLSRVAQSTGMPSASEPRSLPTGASSRALGSLAAKAVFVAALVGAGTYALRTQHVELVPPVAEPAPAASPASGPPLAQTASPAESAPGIDIHALPSVTPQPPRLAARARTAESPVVVADALLAEGAAIERARRAIRSGDPTAALAAIDEHAKTFPRGQLAEERESLRVRVLVMQGRREDARLAAEAFTRAYPRSLFQPIVAKAIESLP